jgi:hypothetical protein
MENSEDPPAAAVAVAAGAALLDRERDNWENHIDLGELSMEDPWRCVLGQLYGLYSTGLLHLFGDGWEAVSHGFEVRPGCYTYEDLERAWVAEIACRCWPPPPGLSG